MNSIQHKKIKPHYYCGNSPGIFGLGDTQNAAGYYSLEQSPMTDLESLRNQLRTFAAERDWDQFHSPKNLAAALAVEAAELLENFQWLTEAQSQQLPPEVLNEVRAEVADVLLYLIRISDKLGIELVAAANAKILLNAEKYPVEKARGSSRKYTEL